MRSIEQLPDVEKLRRSEANDTRFIHWISTEIEDALAARREQEEVWQECLRQYEGVPKNPVRSVPIENAPNIEVTLGAIACDALYAQGLSTLFGVSPILTVNATNASFVQHAKALQRFVNWGIDNEFGLRTACEHTLLDDCQLGTGIFYTPWLEHIRKTFTQRVIDIGPRILSVPPEDFLVPGGADFDIQTMPWCDMRMWMTAGELAERKKQNGWKTSMLKPVGMVGWMRSRREALGRTLSNAKTKALYELHRVHAFFDYDDDGIDEAILAIFDRTSQTLAWLDYDPYDERPFERIVYQVRAHLFHGLGPLEMLRPYAEEVTEGHNDRTLNVKLANMRGYVSRTGQVDEGTLAMWAGRNFQVQDPKGDLIPFQMGDIYPSAAENEALTMMLAERRVGLPELSSTSQGASRVFGSRTPAFNVGAALQQQNNRFAPAFDNMRAGAAGAVRQCLWRYHERLLTEGPEGPAAYNIYKVLGSEEGRLVVDVLSMADFQQSVAVELTASSASVNRDADRQNAMLLVNILGSYYQRTVELISLAAQPGVPPQVRDVAQKIANAAGEIIERTIRTFDQVRDPQSFIIDINREIDSIPDVDPAAIAGLAQQLIGGGASGNANGGLPEGRG